MSRPKIDESKNQGTKRGERDSTGLGSACARRRGADLYGAIYGDLTRWPDSFDSRKSGAILAEKNEND